MTGAILSLAQKVLPWALRHPFIMRPAYWVLGAVAWFAGTSALIFAAGLSDPTILGGLSVVLLFLLTGSYGWHRLTAPSEKPIVYITQFASTTKTGEEAAATHREAIAERIRGGLVGDHLEVRDWPAPVKRLEATRLLKEVPASAVVFGSVQAIADKATWRAELVAVWPGDDAQISAHITGDYVVERFERDKQLPERHEAVLDVQAPLEELIAERFEADHADRIEGTLLALIATQAIEEDEAACRAALAEADAFRGQLSERTRASLEIARTVADPAPNPLSQLQALEAAGLQDADHADLWNHLTAMSFYGFLAGEVSANERLKYAERAVAADDSDTTARYNLGKALIAAGRPVEAMPHFEEVANDPVYAERDYLHFALGQLNYNGQDFAAAREYYQRAVDLRPSARGHLYLADAARGTGEEETARRNYLKALRLQPTLVDAHRGYWYAEEGQEPPRAGGLFDHAYKAINLIPLPRRLKIKVLRRVLRLHYRLHPEDSRIHFMLGAHALLDGDLKQAEERLQFAYDLLDGIDIEALARLAVVWSIKGEDERAREAFDQVVSAPNLETGTPPDEEELRSRLLNFALPFTDNPELLARAAPLLEHGEPVGSALFPSDEELPEEVPRP